VRLCLDTSAYSHFKRGDEAIVDVIDAAEWIGVPAVVLGELRTGFSLGSRARENERALAAFLRNPVVEVLVVDEGTSRTYAELVVALRHQGTPLPTNDIWIAANAMAAGATVVTFDDHFSAIQGVGSRVFTPSS
jgi:tRNA(fMet)-specific endonuclease VapC